MYLCQMWKVKNRSFMRTNKIDYILIHHTGGEVTETLKQIDDYHKSLRFYKSSLGYYVGYHRLIFPDGTIIKTREDTDEGCHCVGYNTNSLSFCLVGNFSRGTWLENHYPTDKQIESLTSLLKETMKQYSIPLARIKYHNHIKRTECPGKNIKQDFIKGLLTEPEQEDKIEQELLRESKTLIEKIREIILQIQRFLQLKKVGGQKEDN